MSYGLTPLAIMRSGEPQVDRAWMRTVSPEWTVWVGFDWPE